MSNAPKPYQGDVWWWTFATAKRRFECCRCGSAIPTYVRRAYKHANHDHMCEDCVKVLGIIPQPSRRYLKQATWRAHAERSERKKEQQRAQQQEQRSA